MAKNLEYAFLYDFYGQMLTEKQRNVMELYYHHDLSLSEISENKGITRQGVRDGIKRAEAQLSEMEQKLGHAVQFKIIKQSIEDIKSAAKSIQESNRRLSGANEIEENAALIINASDKLSDL